MQLLRYSEWLLGFCYMVARVPRVVARKLLCGCQGTRVVAKLLLCGC